MRSFRLAVGLLTVFPVRPTADVDKTTAARAMLLAPVAVLPLALLAAALGGAGRLLGLPLYANGLIFVTVLALGTRALHLDGLADTVDGLGGGLDRDRALAIMRTGDIGPMGVVALVLVLGGQVLAASALLTTPATAVVAALVVCASRACLGVVCAEGIPAARPGGLGHLVAGSVHPISALTSWLGWVVLAALAGSFVYGGWSLLVAGLVASGVLAVLLWRVIRRIGGVTGDVLGAAVELTLTVLLLGAVAVPG
ncbi:MAG: adenosylcobinamide-GDP ribazoletransferase [Propionibacteriaceae bacterium]